VLQTAYYKTNPTYTRANKDYKLQENLKQISTYPDCHQMNVYTLCYN